MISDEVGVEIKLQDVEATCQEIRRLLARRTAPRRRDDMLLAACVLGEQVEALQDTIREEAAA